MSLLDEAMTKCVFIEQSIKTDGYGGFLTKNKGGGTFYAAITFDSSIEARAAEKNGVSSLYTVTVTRSFPVKYHDIFRREKDGKYFRATSDGDDILSPQSSTLDMRQFTAEEFVLNG